MLSIISKIEFRLCAVGSGACLLLMVLIIITSVFGRYLLHTDLIPGTFNIIERILFPVLVFCAIPITYREGMFPRVTYFRSKFPAKLDLAAHWLCVLVEASLYLVIVCYTFRFAWQGLVESRTMQIGSETWILWPILWLLPVTFIIVLVNILGDVLSKIRKDTLNE
ncbi:TRAP transporter small permease [Kineobactrum sediminis]|uniref:TRAP transporter small permease protein n=1 Tax=Kineobactrum sediminis TaxID=1905677 RepID=A0A2N5Y0X7_9GAMM|nr:TRAP transporter small permease [Kineobactrum sediminis]